MKITKVFILWDEQNGYRTSHIYEDKESAEIGLCEHYHEAYIKKDK